jgi:hypothetical protein
MSIFEIRMPACFGVSWPISIYKSLKTRVVAGKSPLFMGIVMLGYAAGITHRILYSQDWVIALSILNLPLAGADPALYFHFSKSGFNAGRT